VVKDHPKTTLILIATGSEVNLALEAAEKLAEKEIYVRVVSLPSPDTFDSQSKEYRESVLPSHIKCRIAVEAAASNYWYKYVGLEGKIIGLNTFGFSAPADAVYKALGITIEKIVEAALEY
jgi:transketolase